MARFTKTVRFPPAGVTIPPYIVMIAGSIEFFGGLLILFGLWTRWGPFIACREMVYAYWTAHGTNALLPVVNRGEMAMLYCFLFLFISAKGSGVLSVDQRWEKRNQKRKELAG